MSEISGEEGGKMLLYFKSKPGDIIILLEGTTLNFLQRKQAILPELWKVASVIGLKLKYLQERFLSNEEEDGKLLSLFISLLAAVQNVSALHMSD